MQRRRVKNVLAIIGGLSITSMLMVTIIVATILTVASLAMGAFKL